MERHVQTVMLAVITAGIVALGSIGWDMSQTIERQKVQLDVVSKTLTDLKEAIDRTDKRFADYMPRTEIDARFETLRNEHVSMNRRLDTLETRRN